MKKLTILSLLFVFSYSLYGQSPKDKGLNAITERVAQAQIEFLAHDELQGREAGFHGARIAREYLKSRLKEMDIQPFFEDGYTQHFQGYRVHFQSKGRWQVHPDSIELIKQDTHLCRDHYNVLGCIPGERTDEYVIIGGHYDHLGIHEDTAGDDKIYNGADDNASGVSAVLQIAKAFLESGKKPYRTLVFAFWDAEETSIIGSQYFMQEFKDPSQIKAYINFDMIGCNHPRKDPNHMMLFYSDSHPEFEQWLNRDIKAYKLDLDPRFRASDKLFGGSDHGWFARKGVPVMYYHSDAYTNYHRPGDEVQHLNWSKIVDITKAAYLATWELVNDKKL